MSTSTSLPAVPGMATVTSSRGGKDAPILETGDLSPVVLDEFIEEAERFHRRAKLTTEVDKVSSVLNSFKSQRIANWIRQNKARLREPTYSFANLMAEVRSKFLDANWAKTIMRTSVNSKMAEGESFDSFINRVVAGNNLLENTPFHKDPAALRVLIDSNISELLASTINHLPLSEQSKLAEIADYDDWDLEMRRIDNMHQSQFKQLRREFQRDFHQGPAAGSKRSMGNEADSGVAPKKNRSDAWTPASGSNAVRTSTSTSSSSSSQYHPPPDSGNGRRRCPPIRPEERALLDAHDGCTMCRQFYVPHRYDKCPNGYPDPKTYRTLTEAMALDAMRRTAVAATRSSSSAGSVHHRSTGTHSEASSSSSFAVGATIPSSYSRAHVRSFAGSRNKRTMRESSQNPIDTATFFAQPDDCSMDSIVSPQLSAPTTTVPNDNEEEINVAPIAAVLPSSTQSAALGNGSDSEQDDSINADDDVSPISVPHLLWTANVFGRDEFPVPVDCMLDSGAHLVLIRPEVVADLALPIRKLHRPVLMSLAVGDGYTTTELSDYVSLSLSSLNNAWCSRPVRALIAPGLCTNVLLGLPFLKHNHIVIDHSLRTAIHKPSGFDLLNESASPVHSRPSPKLSPKEKRRVTSGHWKAFRKELDMVCTNRRFELERKGGFEHVKPFNAVSIIASTIEILAAKEKLAELEEEIKEEFKSIFEPIPHVDLLPTTMTAKIEMKSAYDKISMRTYPCPRQFRESWKKLIQQRLDSGFIRPSSSSFASPSFVIPKADPTALPRWVCDYRQLNKLSIQDCFPLPRVDDILADCAKGKIWATIDMTDSFFQTRMHPDSIHKTAVTTPFGLYEWTVMPMGFKNSPSIHQRRVTNALQRFIGKICHVYLDDIVIWSNSIEEHTANVRRIMNALKDAKLYVNRKKTKLFCHEIKFLGHRISQRGIEADNDKVAKILDWPTPKSSTDVRRFLGLVRYLSAFLPKLGIQAAILNKLTSKECDRHFPEWTQEYQNAFESIKEIVVSRECLTVIDHSKLQENKIFVTTDASDTVTGAVLSFGPTWETARPVAFESTSLKAAELHYPVHEKELLAIMRAIRKWKVDLLGAPFLVYTDHKTLLNFDTQRDMSRRQVRWMEELSIYDCKFVYVKGEDNSVADALSRYPFENLISSSKAEEKSTHPYTSLPTSPSTPLLAIPKISPMSTIAALITIPARKIKVAEPTSYTVGFDDDMLAKLRDAYRTDKWCRKLISATRGMPGLIVRDGLWFINERLMIPTGCGVREHLFRIAHDTLGHFGFSKTYESLRCSYFWPNMRKDLEEGYIPSCADCQRNKSSTSRPAGPLHPLPIPDDRCDSVALDFIGPLPVDSGYNCILTITDRLGSDIRIIPCKASITAEELAVLFFDKWYCENGLPLEVISDRDKLFISRFWKHLTLLTGIKHKCSSAFHPQSDGSSERTNKTAIQAIRFHVERNQKGWVRALPAVRFNIMNSVNKSTGFTPFQLRFGKSPRVLPPLIPPPPNASNDHTRARDVISRLQTDVAEAKDNLMVAKISQAYHANKTRNDDVEYKSGDLVMLSTLNRRRQYKAKGQKRAAKFMPRFDGPYLVSDVHTAASTVTLELPNNPSMFPTFHTSQIKPFRQNDDLKYPARTLEKPGPIEVDGVEEHVVEKLMDHRKVGRGYRFLVRWKGYGPEDDRWLKGSELDDNEALDTYLKENSLSL